MTKCFVDTVCIRLFLSVETYFKNGKVRKVILANLGHTNALRFIILHNILLYPGSLGLASTDNLAPLFWQNNFKGLNFGFELEHFVS
jgi:hypothetical protein